jgi:hypothetical protein
MAKKNNKAKQPRFKLDWNLSGLLIAAVPAIGYVLAYIYERAFCDFYQIPTGLIQLDWNTIITAIAGVLGGLLIVIWGFTVLFFTKNGKPGPYKRRLILIGVLFGTILILSIYCNLTVTEFLIGIGSIAWLAILLFVFPLFRKTPKAYRDKLIADDKTALTNVLKSSQIAKYGFLAVLVLLLFGGITYLSGRSVATGKTQFYIPSSYPNAVVLRIYGQNCICAPVVTKYKIVEKSYFVLNANTPGLTLKLMDMGHLSPVRPNNSVVTGEVVSISSISSNLREVVLKVQESKDVPQYENFIRQLVGQQISVRTVESTSKLQIGQSITTNIKLEIEDGKEIFYASDIRQTQ